MNAPRGRPLHPRLVFVGVLTLLLRRVCPLISGVPANFRGVPAKFKGVPANFTGVPTKYRGCAH